MLQKEISWIIISLSSASITHSNGFTSASAFSRSAAKTYFHLASCFPTVLTSVNAHIRCGSLVKRDIRWLSKTSDTSRRNGIRHQNLQFFFFIYTKWFKWAKSDFFFLSGGTGPICNVNMYVGYKCMKLDVVRLDSDLLHMCKQVIYVTDICQCVMSHNTLKEWHSYMCVGFL